MVGLPVFTEYKNTKGGEEEKSCNFLFYTKDLGGCYPQKRFHSLFSNSCAFSILFRSRSLECHAWLPPTHEKGMLFVCMHPLAKEQLHRGLTFFQASGVLARDKRKLFPISSILRQALFASNLKP